MTRTLIKGGWVVSMDDVIGEIKGGDVLIEDDRIKPGLAVSINGEVTNDGLRAKVAANDEVHFVAAISGGSHPRA